jgi:hypothetical protein
MQAILQFFWILFGNFAAIVEIKAIASTPWRRQCIMSERPLQKVEAGCGAASAAPPLCPSNGPR